MPGRGNQERKGPRAVPSGEGKSRKGEGELYRAGMGREGGHCRGHP